MFYKDLKIKLLETSSKSKKSKSDYTTMIIFFPINTLLLVLLGNTSLL